MTGPAIRSFSREGAAASVAARRRKVARVLVIEAGIMTRLSARGVPAHRWARLIQSDLGLVGIARSLRQIRRDTIIVLAAIEPVRGRNARLMADFLRAEATV